MEQGNNDLYRGLGSIPREEIQRAADAAIAELDRKLQEKAELLREASIVVERGTVEENKGKEMLQKLTMMGKEVEDLRQNQARLTVFLREHIHTSYAVVEPTLAVNLGQACSDLTNNPNNIWIPNPCKRTTDAPFKGYKVALKGFEKTVGDDWKQSNMLLFPACLLMRGLGCDSLILVSDVEDVPEDADFVYHANKYVDLEYITNAEKSQYELHFDHQQELKMLRERNPRPMPTNDTTAHSSPTRDSTVNQSVATYSSPPRHGGGMGVARRPAEISRTGETKGMPNDATFGRIAIGSGSVPIVNDEECDDMQVEYCDDDASKKPASKRQKQEEFESDSDSDGDPKWYL